MNQNHKFCGKCNEVREIQEMKDKGIYKEAAKVIIGSRHMPTYIMYDGEGHYNRKLNQEHQNLKVQIGYNWNNGLQQTEETDRVFKQLTSVSSTDALPRLYNRKRMFQDETKPEKSISIDHQKRFGKYSQRYLHKSNLFGNEPIDYISSSDKYGRFYLSEERPIEFDSPTYNVFPTEKPVLKYHSMKSSLFKQK